MIKQPSILILLILAIFPAFFTGSCTSEHLSPICDTLNMSYANNIVPILKNNCYSCHSAGNTAGSYGVLLDSYDHLKDWAKPGTKPIIADSCYLVGNIKHLPPDSNFNFTPMPYMKPKLDDCSINQIVAWVNQGSPNN